MTHLLDTSAALADVFGEPGEERVDSLINDESLFIGVSVLTLYETYTTVLHRTGSHEDATEAVKNLRESVSEVVPVTEPVLDIAFVLRHAAGARVALAD